MCDGVLYNYQGHIIKTEFKNGQAKLPVLTRRKDLILVPWGRRKGQRGNLPVGGWARLSSIQAGRWDKYAPRPVKLMLQQFMEQDYYHRPQWFQIVKGQWVQGLLAEQGEERRVYIVTIVPEHEEALHDRWPRILLE